MFIGIDMFPEELESGFTMEEVSLRFGRGLGAGCRATRPGEENQFELDGDEDRHCLRAAVDTSASVMEPGREAGRLYF